MRTSSTSASSGISGIAGKIPATGSSVQSRIRDAMYNGTGSYRDIDNAFSAGGHDGNGSSQSAVINNDSLATQVKNALTSAKKVSSYSGGSPRRSGGSGGTGGSGGSNSTSAKEELHYYEAPLAELYGFSPETAYQEALANTSYRREMADMRKAGLNPSVIYGSHNSSGADSGIYPSSNSGGSGGGGGGSRRRSGKSNSGKYLFSGGAYYGIMAGVGAITAIATKNVGAGMAAAGMAGTALKAFNGIFKKK